MPQWTDLFLATPLSQGWLHGLLFLTFGMHLLFVLLMLGTALLGLLFFLRERLSESPGTQLWNARMVHTHLGLKSLAVVLGVAPLLIMPASEVYSDAGIITITPGSTNPLITERGMLMVVMMIWRPRGLIRINRSGFAVRKGVAPWMPLFWFQINVLEP